MAPSALAFRDDEPLPLELDKAGIDKVINDFTVAAQRALKADFKVIEIHAALRRSLNVKGKTFYD